MQDSKLLVAGSISGATNAITGQSVVGTAATAILSQYSVDLTPQNPNGLVSNSGVDIGEGTPLYLKWVITTTITGATGLTVGVVSDSTAALTATPQTLASAPVSALTAGSWGYLQVPAQIGSNGQEFLGASFTPTGANSTAGAIVAEFTNAIDDPKTYYATGFKVV